MKSRDTKKVKPLGEFTREQVLARFPDLQEWIEGAEKQHGTFINMGMITLSAERYVTLAYFSKNIYYLAFTNETNFKDGADRQIWLSAEALFSVWGLAYALGGEDAINDGYKTMLQHMQKAGK